MFQLRIAYLIPGYGIAYHLPYDRVFRSEAEAFKVYERDYPLSYAKHHEASCEGVGHLEATTIRMDMDSIQIVVAIGERYLTDQGEVEIVGEFEGRVLARTPSGALVPMDGVTLGADESSAVEWAEDDYVEPLGVPTPYEGSWADEEARRAADRRIDSYAEMERRMLAADPTV